MKYDLITRYMADVLHWLPVRLVWWCKLSLAPAYLIDLCMPVSKTRGSRPFALGEGGWWSRLPIHKHLDTIADTICYISRSLWPIQRLCRNAHFLWRDLESGMFSLKACACSLNYVPNYLYIFRL